MACDLYYSSYIPAVVHVLEGLLSDHFVSTAKTPTCGIAGSLLLLQETMIGKPAETTEGTIPIEMRGLNFIILAVLLLTRCNSPEKPVQIKNRLELPEPDKAERLKDDSMHATPGLNSGNKFERHIVLDSLIVFDDTLYTYLHPILSTITRGDFELYKLKYHVRCRVDSESFIPGSGVYVINDCNEICETYLAEKNTNRKMLLPSNFDAGISRMLLSPGCKELLVCSSYDNLDYQNYYSHRAEFFTLSVTAGNGLKGVKPDFRYYTSGWSIADVTWIDDNALALKLYKEARTGDGENLKYYFFRTTLKQ